MAGVGIARMSMRAQSGLGLTLDGLLPTFHELKPLCLIQIDQQPCANGNGLECVTELLLETDHGRFTVHVRADRKQIGLVCDQGLTAF
jgi:hypothetical protein